MTRLDELPGRVDALTSQIVQLRGEMLGEFSAVRAEMRALNADTQAQMRMLFEEYVSRMSIVREAQPEARKGRRKK